MTSVSYPFIDLAVLDGVREPLASGAAVLVLSHSLDTVLLANSSGAQIAGFDGPFDIVGDNPDLGVSAVRQIQSLDLTSDPTRTFTLALRVAGGSSSRIVMANVRSAQLPGGERAMVISVPSQGQLSEHASHQTLIQDIADQATHVAILDKDGIVLSASDQFSEIGLADFDLAQLKRETAQAADRMVKRRLMAQGKLIPVGMGRLRDEPSLFIMLAIAGLAQQSQDPILLVPAETPAANIEVHDTADEALDLPQSLPVLDELPIQEDIQLTPPLATVTPAPESEQAKHVTALPLEDTTVQPVRFTWKIDAAGLFSFVSPELSTAIGAEAADITGRSFKDVARVFAFDHGHEIADLLARRDTWSGRSVMWPIAGTDLRAPVDLAALPVYDRDRNFQGFRGFGVVRIAEKTIDPEAIGLALVSPKTSPEVVMPVDSWQGEVPAITTSVNAPTVHYNDDKVVSLGLRRNAKDTKETSQDKNQLSPVERSAFREIADRLRRDGVDLDEQSAQKETPFVNSADAPIEQIAPKLDQSTHPTHELLAVQSNIEPSINDLSDPTDLINAAPAHDFVDLVDEPCEEAELGSSLDPTLAQEPLVLQDSVEPSIGDISVPTNFIDCTVANRPFEEAELSSNFEPITGQEPSSLQNGIAGQHTIIETSHNDTSKPADLIDGTRAHHADELAHVDDDPDYSLPFDPEPSTVDNNKNVDAPILSKLPVPVLIHNGDNLLYGNPAFFELTLYSSLAELEQEGGIDHLLHVSLSDQAAGAQSKIVLADHNEKPVEAHLHSVRWQGQHALLLSLRPLDEVPVQNAHTNETIDNLRSQVDELSSVLETATDGVVFVNNDGTIRSINQSAEALFGFDPAIVAGKPFTHLLAIESQKSANDYIENLSGTGVASLMNDGREVIGREAQGRFIPLFMTVGKLNKDSGYCVVLRDITQWKRAEDDLNSAKRAAEHASTQKSEFLARVSHEIRTPLNAIIGFSEMMSEERFGPVGNARYLDYLNDINRSGKHVLDLVNDLLDISKIEAGQQEMNFESVGLNAALAEAVATMQPQANRDRVIIRSSFASDLPDVVADLRSIKQIALNLLANAVRYTGPGGQVIVSTSYELTGGVAIRVRDTGVGMSAKDIEQALKPFKQINTLKRERGDGTGLGLPLTKAMVEANRASFTISSTPGQGTLIEIAFPSTRVLAE